MNRLKVGVLMGGKSCEREVSFNSGRTVCDHLDTQIFNVIPIFQTKEGILYILPWRFLHRGKTSDFTHRLAYEAQQITWDELKKLIDFMYIAEHGRYAEDGTLQGMLEVLKIPYLGSKLFTSALVMDKIILRHFLQMHDIEIPKGTVVFSYEIKSFDKYFEKILKRFKKEQLEFPLVIKPHKEGSSLGISVVFKEDELYEALIKASKVDENKDQPVVIEEKLNGMEFTCIIIFDKKTNQPIALPITEIVTEEGIHFFDYEQKYMPGRATKITPARCSKEQQKKIQDICIKLMQKLDIKTIARIDGFLTNDGKVIIIDPNTLSGMSPSTFIFRQAAEIGWNHTQLINHLIETELKNYGKHFISFSKNLREQSMNHEKIRVAVLMGGNSNEKEISLESGRNIVYKLSPNKYQPLAVFVNKDMELFLISQQLLVRNTTKEIELGLEPNMKIEWSDLPKICDFVFIALHGGFGENGCVQGMLEMLGLPYNGSSIFASSLCMDKAKTNQFLKFKGFDVPNNLLISKHEWIENKDKTLEKICKFMPFPLIVKPCDDGCSILVKKVNNKDELDQSLNLLFEKNKEEALIEEYIIGMELTVGVIGNDNPKALPPSQAVVSNDVLSIEEKFLPGQGENQTPAPLLKDIHRLIKKTMEDIFKELNCKGYARIDCFYQNSQQSPTGKDRIVILEINTLPGMTPATCIFHQAAEIDIKPMDFVDLIITLGFEEHQSKKIQKDDPVYKLINKFNLCTSTEL